MIRCGNNLYCSKVMYPILSLNYVIGVAVVVRLKPKDKVREETQHIVCFFHVSCGYRIVSQTKSL